MESKINIEEYLNLIEAQFDDNIDGERVLKLTKSKQINLFILKNIYDEWKNNFEKNKLKFFNYEKDEIKDALSNLMNELSYNIHAKDFMRCCYWVEWLLEYETICKSKKNKCKIDRRSEIPVNEKDQMDLVWLIWDLIINYSKKNNNLYQSLIQSLLNIFCLRYTNGIVKKRKFIIYYAISILTEIVNFRLDIITDKRIINQVVSKVNLIYKEIKKNEKTPATDYLFNNNISKANIEKTIEKLDIMKKF